MNICRYVHYGVESYRAAALLIESHVLKKLLVTNVHPNYLLLGCNFYKTNVVVENYMKNMAVVVTSEKELLGSVKAILKSGRHTEKGYVYIYYDRLDFSQVHTEEIEEHCVVFDYHLKLQVNNLLKRAFNFNEVQLF